MIQEDDRRTSPSIVLSNHVELTWLRETNLAHRIAEVALSSHSNRSRRDIELLRNIVASQKLLFIRPTWSNLNHAPRTLRRRRVRPRRRRRRARYRFSNIRRLSDMRISRQRPRCQRLAPLPTHALDILILVGEIVCKIRVLQEIRRQPRMQDIEEALGTQQLVVVQRRHAALVRAHVCAVQTPRVGGESLAIHLHDVGPGPGVGFEQTPFVGGGAHTGHVEAFRYPAAQCVCGDVFVAGADPVIEALFFDGVAPC